MIASEVLHSGSCATSRTTAAYPTGETVFEPGRNISETEQVFSALGAGAFLIAALRRRGLPGVLYALIGGSLAKRAITAHCPMYSLLGRNTATGGTTHEPTMRTTRMAAGPHVPTSGPSRPIAPEFLEQTGLPRTHLGRPGRADRVVYGKDVVQEASEESFPASDPPGWSSGTA